MHILEHILSALCRADRTVTLTWSDGLAIEPGDVDSGYSVTISPPGLPDECDWQGFGYTPVAAVFNAVADLLREAAA